jgi:hypothetical protein
VFTSKCDHEQMKGRGLPQEGHAAAQPQSKKLLLGVLPLASDQMGSIKFFVETIARSDRLQLGGFAYCDFVRRVSSASVKEQQAH